MKFNSLYLGKEEARAAAKAINSMQIVGNGPLGQKAEAMMRKLFGVRHVLLTTSGTHALELALISAGIRAGDEVIMPSFTFVSTANAVIRQKAIPVFAEIDETTFNMDIEDMKKRITKRTKAIMPVHYGGLACDMDRIMKIARKSGIVVIEDAAHGVGAKYKGRYLGTIGDMGCFSFHASKNITCGEGGALLTSNEKYYAKAEIGREKGTNRAAYMKGSVDKYSWIGEGSSYVLSDILAGVLMEQLKKIDEITDRRKHIFNYYLNGLKALQDSGTIMLPRTNEYCDINGHIFYVRLNTERDRDRLLRELKKKGIEATFHFIPLHTSPYGRKMFGYRAGDFPVTERVSKTLLRLPLYPQITKGQLDFVIKSICDILS